MKLGITGGPGHGKTYSSLRLATGLAAGQPIAGIDTENGSMSLYADAFNFDVVTLVPPFTDDKFVEAINAAVSAGYAVAIIDSFSHAWEAVLDYKTMLDSKGGNSYVNWGNAGKKFKSVLAAVLHSPIHVICCLRSKMQYTLEMDVRGKQVPRKIGMEPITRDGSEYEFSTVFDIGFDHCATVSKDRTNLFVDQHFQVTENTGSQFLAWLNSAPETVTVPGISAEAVVEALLSPQDRLQAALYGLHDDWITDFLIDRKQISAGQTVLDLPDTYCETALARITDFRKAIVDFGRDHDRIP